MSLSGKLIATSLGIGLSACFSPYALCIFSENSFVVGALISLVLQAIWWTRLGALLMAHGKRGLWFLVGLPFTAFWPVVLSIFWWACKYRNACL
jgi:hypothetical protein